MEHDIVFITGSSAGIGRAAALLFAARGSSLVITYCHDQEAGARVREECLQAGARDVMLLNLDLADDDSIRRAVYDAVSHYHAVDVLINNAGTIDHGALSEQTFALIDHQLKTNLTGTIKLTKECLSYVRKSIITIGSTLGLRGRKRLSIYAASKFGLRGFTQALAQEHPELFVFVVNPGLTATRMGSERGMDPGVVGQIIVNASLGRYRLKPGSDINVRDYRYGPRLGKVRSLLRALRDGIIANV
ncbi:hypothetical protein A3J36_00940 [Candidatus Uhrbacteria bacterium RIFCSPLOWO2_02_FULL_54_37]|uniref:Short-chain dehydrogenase n=1 Tax=Candidatus Uhrbacteria bacterium RIFCSPLOWO2_02_FULL_54_37 TaxID=1802412 RepID=A0A1F7VL73_9BACT|nr:MAG: hypothetical protein A3J36_00940 [Candidatus Uhrbacteria bacterium RIFCSPLOWO2_02_FULL_54_37]